MNYSWSKHHHTRHNGFSNRFIIFFYMVSFCFWLLFGSTQTTSTVSAQELEWDQKKSCWFVALTVCHHDCLSVWLSATMIVCQYEFLSAWLSASTLICPYDCPARFLLFVCMIVCQLGCLHDYLPTWLSVRMAICHHDCLHDCLQHEYLSAWLFVCMIACSMIVCQDDCLSAWLSVYMAVCQHDCRPASFKLQAYRCHIVQHKRQSLRTEDTTARRLDSTTWTLHCYHHRLCNYNIGRFNFGRNCW